MGTNDLMCPHYADCPVVKNYIDKVGTEEQIRMIGEVGCIHFRDSQYHCRVLELNNKSKEHPKHRAGIPERCAFIEQIGLLARIAGKSDSLGEGM